MKYAMLFALALWASYSNAQVYSCKTPDGKTTFQAQPCESGQIQTEQKSAPKGASLNPPGCDHPLLGHWRLTHISEVLDKDLIASDSQKWTFSPDGMVENDGFIKQDFPYTCSGSEVVFKSAMENKLEIVRSTATSMVWHSIDFTGYLYVER
ncbi:DUF4124 domain-containing protein [Pseudomonas turukhanskensis]|uniref:DUF4124 domain-containing protein n=1 Tax=Pseudomonas turukhanskensis TaxID=1806536 RepID=A0A9W6K472_9PSED|nr:DUF4124 domain-containing protein [Pseudomonas turukhanskensis]GLK88552.1 hypothetical protein GCM10017655_16140 [Pseudomonas turukhanskensis]